MTDEHLKYRCNCGQEFDARMDRIKHMVKCPVMAERAAGREWTPSCGPFGPDPHQVDEHGYCAGCTGLFPSPGRPCTNCGQPTTFESAHACRPANPGITDCCGGTVYKAHGFGICWGPRWIRRLRGYPVMPARNEATR